MYNVWHAKEDNSIKQKIYTCILYCWSYHPLMHSVSKRFVHPEFPPIVQHTRTQNICVMRMFAIALCFAVLRRALKPPSFCNFEGLSHGSTRNDIVKKKLLHASEYIPFCTMPLCYIASDSISYRPFWYHVRKFDLPMTILKTFRVRYVNICILDKKYFRLTRNYKWS